MKSDGLESPPMEPLKQDIPRSAPVAATSTGVALPVGTMAAESSIFIERQLTVTYPRQPLMMRFY